MDMTIGDVLELIGIGCLVAAAYLYLGAPLALLAIGLGLGYLAQCYNEPMWWPRKMWRRNRGQSKEQL